MAGPCFYGATDWQQRTARTDRAAGDCRLIDLYIKDATARHELVQVLFQVLYF